NERADPKTYIQRAIPSAPRPEGFAAPPGVRRRARLRTAMRCEPSRKPPLRVRLRARGGTRATTHPSWSLLSNCATARLCQAAAAARDAGPDPTRIYLL